MTNWNDPALEAAEGLALVKLIHVVAGLCIWEFVLNLDYEYSIVTRKRKLKWSSPFYLACRWCSLLAMILYLVNLTTPDRSNCKAWAIVTLVFVYAAYESGSFLIMLRIYALWERKRIITMLTLAFWLSHVAAFIYDIAITRASWDGTGCNFDTALASRLPLLSLLIMDLVLLGLMLFGVLRWKATHIKGDIRGLVYMQGLIYVAVATLAYIPLVIFLTLNLNRVMNEIFLVPSMTVMSIGSLRMYRGLIDSVTANGPLNRVVGATRPSTIRFAYPNSSEENTHNTGGLMPDP